jgi:hypothetical protein
MKDESELCCNLWAIFDSGTEVIYRLAGKSYALQGTDEDKLSVLRKLSAFDYQTADTVKLPERFSLVGPEGQVKKGVTRIHAFYDQNSVLFNELFEHIERQLPPTIGLSQKVLKTLPQKLPSVPLCISTLVFEDEMGNRRAIVTDEDRKWLEEIGFGSTEDSKVADCNVTENDEDSDDDANSIRSEIKRYFHGHMDMARAITEQNTYAGAPEHCDLCSGNFIDDGFMVDGAIRGQAGWACMCMNCFGRHAQGLGWGVGQLYKNEGKLGWLQVACFQE